LREMMPGSGGLCGIVGIRRWGIRRIAARSWRRCGVGAALGFLLAASLFYMFVNLGLLEFI
jgi:hypothetical protein